MNFFSSNFTYAAATTLSGNSTPTFQSVFLRPGDSYRDKTAASTLSMSVATVAVLVAMSNTSLQELRQLAEEKGEGHMFP